MRKITAAFLLILPLACSAQSDTSGFFSDAVSFNKKRFYTVVGTEGALYAGSLIGLNQLWYRDYPHASFHFFDDNPEWQHMDKCGHVMTSYYIGRIGIGLLKWSGVEKKKAAWYGGMLGSAFLLNIEILDGFSSQWGFSWGDFGANTLGSVLVIGQELGWNEQRMVLKFSFHQTGFPKYRPDLLGRSFNEQIIKDYNGQTYWLSANISSFLGKESVFPKWLNVAFGYGARGMTGGRSNPVYTDANGNTVAFERYPEFYFALDADLSRIRTRSKFLKAVFNTFGFIKIPAPALGFSRKGVSAVPFYF